VVDCLVRDADGTIRNAEFPRTLEQGLA
jgi:hypothetical protein